MLLTIDISHNNLFVLILCAAVSVGLVSLGQ